MSKSLPLGMSSFLSIKNKFPLSSRCDIEQVLCWKGKWNIFYTERNLAKIYTKLPPAVWKTLFERIFILDPFISSSICFFPKFKHYTWLMPHWIPPGGSSYPHSLSTFVFKNKHHLVFILFHFYISLGFTSPPLCSSIDVLQIISNIYPLSDI